MNTLLFFGCPIQSGLCHNGAKIIVNYNTLLFCTQRGHNIWMSSRQFIFCLIARLCASRIQSTHYTFLEMFLRDLGGLQRDLYFLNLFILFLHTCYIYICMLPACCFCQRTCVAQGLLMGYLMRLELTLVSSINDSCRVRRVYIAVVVALSCSANTWRAPRGLFWTSVRSVALEKEQWQTWGL